jgi:hypothetical protein
MGLDAATIQKFIADFDSIDKNNLEQLLEFALKLLYPANIPTTPPSPIDENLDLNKENFDVIRKRNVDQQKELNNLVLKLLKLSWYCLQTAVNLRGSPQVVAACQREQALFILRILNIDSELFELTDKMAEQLEDFVGKDYFAANFAERLIEQAADAGDIIAQLFSVRRLLHLVQKRIPLLPIKTGENLGPKIQCFHSWLANNPAIAEELKRFSDNLRSAVVNSTLIYDVALSRLINEYRSYNLCKFFADPEQLPMLNVLKAEMPVLRRNELTFRVNWNDAMLLLITEKEKIRRSRLYGDSFFLDRSQSAPRPARPLHVIKPTSSDPDLQKADENDERQIDPKRYILHTPKSTYDEGERANKIARVMQPK